MTPLAEAVAAVWRARFGAVMRDDTRGFAAAMERVLRPAWHARCRAAGVPVVAGPAPDDVGAASRLVTPRCRFDVDDRRAAEELGGTVERALDELAGMAREAGVAAVAEVEFSWEREAYLFNYFLSANAYLFNYFLSANAYNAAP